MNKQLYNTSAGYSSLSLSIHWIMLALIVASYASMDLKGLYPRGIHESEVMLWHYTCGLTVFFWVWIRLAARCIGTSPVVNPPMPAAQIILSKFVHLALYALMICLPMFGWLEISAQGAVLGFYGLELPTLVDKNKELFHLFKRLHEILATVGYFLIGLHAAAALFHHYFKCDNTLSLMVPRLRRPD